MKLLDRTREGPKLTDAGRVSGLARRRGDRAPRGGRARARRDRRARGRRAAAGQLSERQRHGAHRGRLDLSPPLSDGAAERHRRRARGLAATAARRRARPRAELRLSARSRSRASATSTATLLLSESMYLALPRATRSPRNPVVPLAELEDFEWLCGSRPSSCGEVVVSACRNAGFEPHIGFEIRRLQRDAGLHRRRPRRHPAARPRAADPALGPRRPRNRPARPGAPRLGGDPGRGLALAGDRGDAEILVEVGAALVQQSAELRVAA